MSTTTTRRSVASGLAKDQVRLAKRSSHWCNCGDHTVDTKAMTSTDKAETTPYSQSGFLSSASIFMMQLA